MEKIKLADQLALKANAVRQSKVDLIYKEIISLAKQNADKGLRMMNHDYDPHLELSIQNSLTAMLTAEGFKVSYADKMSTKDRFLVCGTRIFIEW